MSSTYKGKWWRCWYENGVKRESHDAIMERDTMFRSAANHMSFPQKIYSTKSDLPSARREISIWTKDELDLQG